MAEHTADSTAPGTPAADASDAMDSDAGKRALAALRDENKSLKARIKALEANREGERDAAPPEATTSEETSEGRDAPNGEPAADGEGDDAMSPAPADATKPTGRMSLNDFDSLSPEDREAVPQERRPMFQGTGDGGARKATSGGQIRRTELDRMSPAEIDAARRAGRLDDLLRNGE